MFVFISHLICKTLGQRQSGVEDFESSLPERPRQPLWLSQVQCLVGRANRPGGGAAEGRAGLSALRKGPETLLQQRAAREERGRRRLGQR